MLSLGFFYINFTTASTTFTTASNVDSHFLALLTKAKIRYRGIYRSQIPTDTDRTLNCQHRNSTNLEYYVYKNSTNSNRKYSRVKCISFHSLASKIYVKKLTISKKPLACRFAYCWFVSTGRPPPRVPSAHGRPGWSHAGPEAEPCPRTGTAPSRSYGSRRTPVAPPCWPAGERWWDCVCAGASTPVHTAPASLSVWIGRDRHNEINHLCSD